MIRPLLISAIAGALIATVVSGPSHADSKTVAGAEKAAATHGVQIASRTAPGDVLSSVDVLSEKDAGLYGKIFTVQRDGKWRQADKLIRQLDDKILLGHVLAQRYLHPTKYRSSYKELKAWMGSYADHPDAGQLYKLAIRRRPKNWRHPVPPRQPGRSWSGFELEEVENLDGEVVEKIIPKRRAVPRKRLSKSDRRRARSYQSMVRNYLRKGATKSAKQLIGSKKLHRLLSNAQLDELQTRLAFAYLLDGRTEWAFERADRAANRSGNYIVKSHWIAGLAAWRLQRHEAAAKHFEAVGEKAGRDSWLASAGAFWAARVHLVARNPEAVSVWLDKAAGYPQTFYGLLAGRLLGRDVAVNVDMPPLDDTIGDRIARSKRGKRALALLQVSRLNVDATRRAERELRNLAFAEDRDTAVGVLAVAGRLGLASLSLKLHNALYPKGGGFAAISYPMPHWKPRDGFRVDKALIYAVIRQESAFNPKAKSWAGARGLMQLMPRTAGFVARDRRYYRTRSKRRDLFEPKVNLALGQKYIEMLLSDRKIKGDLFLMAAAWNGGPGNLNRWRRRVDDGNDPLFFIETLPSRETRVFIERVLSNFWVYRKRMNQPAPSLDALAAGHWPVYTGLDHNAVQVAGGLEKGQEAVNVED